MYLLQEPSGDIVTSVLSKIKPRPYTRNKELAIKRTTLHGALQDLQETRENTATNALLWRRSRDDDASNSKRGRSGKQAQDPRYKHLYK